MLCSPDVPFDELAWFEAYLAEILPDPSAWARFMQRLAAVWPRLTVILSTLYGDQPDFATHQLQIIQTAAQAFAARPPDLHRLDAAREVPGPGPRWFQREQQIGGVCYVDRYAGSLAGIRQRIPYFRELGLTYLHLMPLYRSPPGDNDGGYAVSDFRMVDPALGTMAELADLARELRANGISLVLDFVMNHTANDHPWALRASAGDPAAQAYYWCFPDRTLPDQYERHLREIFPDQASGNFTYIPAMDRWVWTTFHPYQWDLNYRNPALFAAMLGELLFLANQGAEVLRLDAVPFIWKQLGTTCENLPEAHLVIEALHLLARVAAPALIFKSEAIVHPAEVIRYLGAECTLSYNPLLMVLLWEALATGEVRYLQWSMRERFALPPGTAWVNYVRSHDDIGWGFANEDAEAIGLSAPDLRLALNAFFTNQAPGSFARGLPFNFNPRTNDMRISGTTASLAGLEAAQGDPAAEDLAIRRMLLIMGITIAAGGIPLIYLGDEVGQLNDYGYRADPARAEDSRWVHRPASDPLALAARHDQRTIPGRLFMGVRRMVQTRRTLPVFAATNPTEWPESGNPQVLLMHRQGADGDLRILGNFSATEQVVDGRAWSDAAHWQDLLTGAVCAAAHIVLPPYALVWLVRVP